MLAKLGEADREYTAVVGNSPAKDTMSPEVMFAELQLAPSGVTISVSTQETEGAKYWERLQ